MQHTLVAVFDNRTDAQNAMNELMSSNFSRENVRLSTSDTSGAAGTTDVRTTTDTDEGIGSSIKHFFSDLFGSDDSTSASRYETAVSGGRHVLTLTADSLPEVERAADIVERYGPTDIDEHSDRSGSMAGAGMTGAMAGSSGLQQSSSMSAQSASQGANLQGTRQRTDSLQRDTAAMGSTSSTASIPVVEEQLRVGKREVQRGGVRIFSRVIETPVNESIGLREEHVNVERHRVDQPINPNDATAFKEQTIEMRETAEEAVVQKTARVVEEVTVGKQVSERQQQVKDTVRHTEVEVERLGATGNMRDDDSYYRSHFTSNYGSTGASYDDYAPAYSYGSSMRGDSRYADRKWDDVENDLRTDWESRNAGGPSTWEKMKAAVRRGWDRMTDDDDDNYYRSHYTSTYGSAGGSYDDYAPAYSYGSQMRSDSRYANRQWDDVENDLRTDWETRNAGRTGSTWENMKAAVRRGWDRMTDNDDDYYRSHYTSNYSSLGGSYEDYAPAYSYGSQMRSDSRYANRQWDDVESDLRSDWETRYPGSTWERMKAAVRRGWDRMTDDNSSSRTY
ncbi:YsnF/AvaK domain-containing protein [Massilia sp. ZL223]|uniref:YsnF/AvaK domain-containing protein n=1 Tax=Massilia sp. ZL223 TaxID=2824904 RepID=UPI001E3444CD|nr:YsnF/AvaK domain-containing protein [Massilia sp. ZL223]